MLETTEHRPLLSALEANWQTEMERHATYKALARTEPDSRRRNVMRGLWPQQRSITLTFGQQRSTR